MKGLNLTLLPQTFAICRLSAADALPSWAQRGAFLSISRTDEELSIVCEQANVPLTLKAECDWRCLKVEGPLDFALTGVLAEIASALAEAKISLFAVSTFDTDYILVKSKEVDGAVHALRARGHRIGPDGSRLA